MSAPAAVRAYLERLVERLALTVGERLVAVYVVGSLALDDYRPGHSDIDVLVIVRSSLTREEKLAIADCCSSDALACPARRLELVVISADEARAPAATPRWELNFNTGSAEADHIGLDPMAEPSHWFVLDLALAAERGIVLLGPPAATVIGSPSAAQVHSAQMQTIVWYARHGMPAEASVAACRAWHWRATGTFAGKRRAVKWARGQLTASDPRH